MKKYDVEEVLHKKDDFKHSNVNADQAVSYLIKS